MHIQRQSETFAFRVADNKYDPAVNELTGQLVDEFTNWWGEQVGPDDAAWKWEPPFSDWGRIEDFLKQQYPAAHRGLDMGMESAQPLMDQDIGHFGDPIPKRAQPYQTGPEAVEQHGYDPKEIAAAMLLLHNQAHGYRHDLKQMDQERLYDIAQKRYQMQRAYESREPAKIASARRIFMAALHMGTAPTILPGFSSEEEIIRGINALLSNSRIADATALFQLSGLPLERINRRSEIEQGLRYPEQLLEQSRERVQANPSDYTFDEVHGINRHRRIDEDAQKINQLVNEGRTKDAVEAWTNSSVMLGELEPEVAEALKNRVGLWGFPGERQWGENPEFDWHRNDYEEYAIGQYHRNGGNVPARIPMDDPRLSDPESYMDDDEYLGNFYEDDEDEDDDDYGDDYDPGIPDVVNTADPNAKLQSEWSSQIKHYPQSDHPDIERMHDSGLYDEFDFQGPAYSHARGLYQINHPDDPENMPPIGYLQYYKRDPKTMSIGLLDTHPNYRLQGVATALVNQLAEDNPDMMIDPGGTTEHGTAFVNRMREIAPNADKRLQTRYWEPNVPNELTDEQMKEWGVKERKSPIFARIAAHNRMVMLRHGVT